MKIVHLTTSMHGGAGIAANRLNEAMQRNGIDSVVLCRQDISDFYRKKHFIRLFCEKIRQKKADYQLNRLHVQGSWDSGFCGINPLRHPVVATADVIYLHWINGGFLGIEEIGLLLKSGKRIVWVMHDQWPFTGGCHYAFDCRQYEETCLNCPLCGSHGEMTEEVFHKKLKCWGDCSNLRLVSPSKWLADCADRSRIFGKLRTSVIRNTLDFQVFRPRDKQKARRRFGFPLDKRIIAIAIASATYYKGVNQVFTLAKKLQYEPFVFVSVGDLDIIYPQDLFNFKSIGSIHSTDAMADYYNAADAVLITSAADNYPNVLLEAAACGIPAVGYQVGGIPELIINGETGYLVPLNDIDACADRLKKLMYESNIESFSSNTLSHILSEANPEHVVAQHRSLWS